MNGEQSKATVEVTLISASGQSFKGVVSADRVIKTAEFFMWNEEWLAKTDQKSPQNPHSTVDKQ